MRVARTIARAALMAALATLPIVTVLSVASRPALAQAQEEVDVAVFDEPLSEHGEWFEHPRHGRVWYPRDVDIDWRPYSVGRWAYTEEYGWTWESEERFGWATYHYGRWDHEPRYGWIWVPGRVWGPAWVEWRTGDGYIGWAPLTPSAVWRDDRIVYSERVDYAAPRWRPYWVFVSEPLFIRPSLHRHCEPPARNVNFVNRTTIVTNYTTINNNTTIVNNTTVVNRRIVNNAINVQRIERVTNQPVVVARVQTVGKPEARTFGQPQQLAIFRPPSAPVRPATTPVTGTPQTPSSQPSTVPGAGPGRPGGGPGAPAGAGPGRPGQGQGPGRTTAVTPPTQPQPPFGQSTPKPPPPGVTSPSPKPPPPAATAPTQPPRQPQFGGQPSAGPGKPPPPQAQPDAARLAALRQRQDAERKALIESQRAERTTAPVTQQPQVLRDQFRERGEQRRIQEQQRDVAANRPQPPRIPQQPQPPRAAVAPTPPPQRSAPPPPQSQPQKKPPQPGQPGQPPPR